MEEEQAVVPKDHGVNLPVSWRMEPSLTALTSKLFYKGERQGKPANCVNRVHLKNSCQGLNGLLLPEQGLVFEQVEHTGRSVHAPEEIDRIEELIEALLGSNYTINKKGTTEEGLIDSNKILVIAPYNVQVNKLEERLSGRARVGTVDRFQGQEEPVCIYSLTASSGNDAPRGIDFLLEENRINVAISRGQCLVLITGSPSLMRKRINKISEAKQLSQLARISNQHQLTKW